MKQFFRVRNCKLHVVLTALALTTVLLLHPNLSISGTIPPTDDQITAAIKRSLILNIGAKTKLIDIETKDGIVSLSGVTNNLLISDQVVETTQTIQGVRAVVDKIHISGVNRPDKETEKALKIAFERDPVLEAYQISGSVEDGVATLTGKVDSYQEKTFATEAARGVKGVRKVHNIIEAEPKEHRFDDEIKAEVERRLKSNVWIFDGGITVEVKNGKVILSGAVGSEAEKNRVRYNSWVAGVEEVDDLGLAVNSWIRSEDLRKSIPVSLEEDEIKDAVREVFLLDPRLKAAEIDIQVKEGIVSLAGKVKHIMIKRAAQQNASNTIGVKQVINNIQVNLEDTPTSDEEFAGEIENALANHPITEDVDLKIKVQNKKVSLHGEVKTLYEKALVEHVVSSTRGVETIDNQLSVLSSWPKKKDEKIRQDIQNLISWSLFVNGEDILVTVENGVAVFSGKVFDWKAVHRAVEKGFQGGAKMVKTDLTLENGEDAKANFDYRDIRVGL